MHIVGVDEVGRGPLAGPVVACALAMDASVLAQLPVADSKKLSVKARERLCERITQSCYAWGVGMATSSEIDSYNILKATLLAMRRAVMLCPLRVDKALIDGTHAPDLSIKTECIIGGDGSVALISAASIVAKVMRDRMLCAYDKLYPDYGFAGHKGYGTAKHRQALEAFGPTPWHRKSFAPVARALASYSSNKQVHDFSDA